MTEKDKLKKFKLVIAYNFAGRKNLYHAGAITIHFDLTSGNHTVTYVSTIEIRIC